MYKETFPLDKNRSYASDNQLSIYERYLHKILTGFRLQIIFKKYVLTCVFLSKYIIFLKMRAGGCALFL